MTRLTNSFVMTLDDGGATIDAAPGADVAPTVDAGTPDATAPAVGCGEFAAPVATLALDGAKYEGDLAGATADLDFGKGVTCDALAAPEGLLAPGIDQVLQITGMTAGSTYYVRLVSVGDLNVSVLSGCTEGTVDGPAAGQCAAYVDEFGAGAEVIAFVAPAAEAYLVVDNWVEETPASTAYTLEVVTEPGCLVDEDCTDATAAICQRATGQCIDRCEGDDAAAEVSDDTPEGATVLDISGTATVSANICQNEQLGDEFDFYAFTVADGGAVTIALEWADRTADVDVEIRSADLETTFGLSFYQNPETIELSYLPAGTYYVQVSRFAPADSSAVTPYTLTVTPHPVELCTADADCATEFVKQLFRGDCNTTTGACQSIAGAGAVALGGVCDSDDDCAAGAAQCTSFIGISEPDTRAVCTKTCTTDAECPANLGSLPEEGSPWAYLTCTAEGACQL
jgi:hypothetical protein